MVFRVTFLVFALISLLCLILGIKVKRRNIGFLFTLALAAVMDIVCFLLLGCKGVAGAKTILTVFYVCHAWFGFGLLWTGAVMGRYRNSKRYLIPGGLICVYQTVLMAGSLFGAVSCPVQSIFCWARHGGSRRMPSPAPCSLVCARIMPFFLRRCCWL